MDCHSCIYLGYEGRRLGKCTHPNHPDVEFVPRSKRRKRPYNKDKCPDFVLFRRCANCKYWERGKYFADGKTPARKGRCSLSLPQTGRLCHMWKRR
jgi:hypothetical protein